MEKRFVFIIPFRNVSLYIKECYESILNQKYQNWIAIFCDDESTDGTLDLIPNDEPRFIKRRNDVRVTALPNIHNGIINSDLNDEDIICILDGDDYLIREDSLDIISELYNDETLLTYGQYVFPDGRIGHCHAYNELSFIRLRNGGYLASHMRTFKYKLYKEILVQDPKLKCFKNNNDEFYTITYDVAIMTPLMEIAGYNKIKFNPTPIYYYRLHPNNDHMIDHKLQVEVANEIFAKEKFNQIF